MEFGAFAEAVQTSIGELGGRGRKSRRVHADVIGEKIVERFRAGVIGSIFEEIGAEIFGEADDFKEMAVAIARERGNAHAGENFSQAGSDGDAHAVGAAGFEGFGKFVGEIRHDSACTGGDEKRDVMRVKDLRGLDDERHIPEALANHRFPDGGGSQQRGECGGFRVEAAIGKEEEARASAATQRGRR